MRCKHCQDDVIVFYCEKCGLLIKDQCVCCHAEATHGRMPKQSILEGPACRDKLLKPFKGFRAHEIR